MLFKPYHIWLSMYAITIAVHSVRTDTFVKKNCPRTIVLFKAKKNYF